MKKILFSLVAVGTLAFSFDGEFNIGCEEIFELGQEKLKIEAQLLDMANSEIGVDAKNLYCFAKIAKNDFKVISVAFEACQANKPFKLKENTLDTFDRVQVEKNKLAFYKAMDAKELQLAGGR